jgi:hypothetical protein
MPFVVRAFPLVRPVAEAQAFFAQLKGPKRADVDRFYKQFGVNHEAAYLQDTPNGPLLIVVTVIKDDKEAAPRYQRADTEFEAWFKSEVKRLSGVDPNVTPLGPPTTELFRWP